MGAPKISRAEFEALKPYATENELMWLNACIKHDGPRPAARAIERPVSLCFSAIRTVRKRAARRGWAPEHGWNPPAAPTKPHGTTPEGFEIGAKSILRDADGEQTAVWDKLRPERAPAEAPPPDFLLNKVSQFTDSQGNLIGQWKSFSPERAERWEAAKAAIAEAVKPYEGGSGCFPGPQLADLQETLTIYGLGDPHVGMLAHSDEAGENFDLKIADAVTNQAVIRLLAAAPPSRVGGLVLIGDNFHAQNDQQVTPGHGHKLDVDGRFSKVWRVGTRLWRIQIDRMLEKHDQVLVWVVCGNHDPDLSFLLAEWLRAWYRDEPRVTIGDNIREHQYYLYGKVLLGFTHGHRSKPDALGGIMAEDVPEWWAKAKAERHWFTGHIHSKTFWELRGCTLETLRTLAASDAYATRAGYRSKRASVAVTYDPELGEIMRATVGVR